MTTRTDGPDWFHTAADAPPDGHRTGPVAVQEVADAAPDLDPDDHDLLDDWAPPQRAGRLTTALALGLLAALVFTGGALVQKQFGGGPAASAGAAGGFPGGRAGGFPGGGELPAGGFPGAAAGQAGQAGQAGSAGSAGSAGAAASGAATAAAGTSSAPAVVGTVTSVDGTDLVVENFAKKSVTVHVPVTATVTTPGLAAVAAGMTVTVVGTKAADGTVTATSVVARRAA